MHDTKAVQEAAEHIKSIGATVAEMSGRLDGIELAINRPAMGEGPGAKSAAPSLETKAFGRFLREGRDVLEAPEQRALTVSNDANGGYLATPAMAGDVLKRIAEISPVRQVANVQQLGSRSIRVPSLATTIGATWVDEVEQRSTSNMTFSQLEIVAHETATIVEVSQQLLEDSSYSVENLLSDQFSEQFALAEARAFVVGDGQKRPYGFLTRAAADGSPIEAVPSGSATDIPPDSLIATLFALKAAYRQRSTWMANRRTIAYLRTLKDSTGRYLFDSQNGGLVFNNVETLLGRPILEAADLPDMAAGSLPVAIADWSRAYWVLDRVGLSVLRDPYSLAGVGTVRFVARRRVGGDVVLPEAMKVLRVAAS